MVVGLESSGWRRGGKKNWLMPGTWSFTAVMYQHGPFSAPAVGISTGQLDAVSSLWSSRISCMSGLWSPARLDDTKPLSVHTRTQLLRIFTHSGPRWRNSWGAWGSSPWTIGSRASFGFLRDRVHRDRFRSREPAGYYLRSSRGVYPTLTRRTAATHSFVYSDCCVGRKMQRS